MHTDTGAMYSISTALGHHPSPSWMAWPYLIDLLPDEDKNVGVEDILESTGGGIFHRDLVPRYSITIGGRSILDSIPFSPVPCLKAPRALKPMTGTGLSKPRRPFDCKSLHYLWLIQEEVTCYSKDEK